MSKEELGRFTKEVEENEALKAEVVKLGTDGEAIVKFAQEKGYDISMEDLEQAKKDAELSDTDLDNVAGGALGFKTVNI